MKRKYNKPTIRAEELLSDNSLLAGSDIHVKVETTPQSAENSYSKGYKSLWDTEY